MPPVIYMPIGLPGIGKSTFLKHELAQTPAVWIDRDAIRSQMNGGDATVIAKNERKVAAEAMNRFKTALQQAVQGGPEAIALDATYINQQNRRPYLTALQEFSQQHPVLLKVFQFPNDVVLALSRQAGRARQVDKSLIETFARIFQPFRPSEITDPKAQIALEMYNVAADNTVTKKP